MYFNKYQLVQDSTQYITNHMLV